MRLGLLLILLPFWIQAQLSLQKTTDLGSIPPSYEIKGDLVISNAGNSKIFLMRADADPGVKIFTSKKTLQPGDTCLLLISFLPDKKGPFSKDIRLVSSDRVDPYRITLKGDLQELTTDNKQLCYYFGKSRQNKTNTSPAIIPPLPEVRRDNSNKMPEQPSEPVVTTPRQEPEKEKPVIKKQEPAKTNPDEMPAELRPNNLIFLVDVSGSMKDSLKLPVMKKALHELIRQVRDVDKLTFITYADTIKIITEAGGPAQREQMYKVVDGLRAKGMTKGRKAILFSQQTAQRHFIPGGNNQIIIVTDGQFKFEKEDQKLWNERQGQQKIILSTMMLGTDKEAQRNLKDIARKCDGSFIHVQPGDNSAVMLMEEIRQKSK